MQERVEMLPWLIEVCPASTLKRYGLYRFPYAPYKGRTEENRAAREHILKVLVRDHTVQIAVDLKARVLDNRGGDALDSIVAALATFQAVQNDFRFVSEGRDDRLVEGYVYT